MTQSVPFLCSKFMKAVPRANELMFNIEDNDVGGTSDPASVDIVCSFTAISYSEIGAGGEFRFNIANGMFNRINAASTAAVVSSVSPQECTTQIGNRSTQWKAAASKRCV